MKSLMVTLSDIRLAQANLRGIASHTRLIEFDHPAGHARRLFLKPENQQPIGAFKLRGAYNKIASLSPEDRKRGVISYSSGNHAQGVAYAARALGVKAVIVMPDNAPEIKREATAALGAEIVIVGPGSAERQTKAEELAAQHGYVIVSLPTTTSRSSPVRARWDWRSSKTCRKWKRFLPRWVAEE